MANELTNCGCANCRDARRAIEPVLTRAEAEARLTDEVVMAVFELLDWDTRAGSCDQARQTVLSALFPEGG